MRIKTGETSQIQHEALKSSAKVLLFSDIRKENRKIIFRAIFVEKKKNYMVITCSRKTIFVGKRLNGV